MKAKNNNVRRDTPAKLFDEVLKLVKEDSYFRCVENAIESIWTDHRDTRKLTDYHFDFKAVVKKGSNEGLYLHCSLEGKFDGSGKDYLHIGSIKSLRDDAKSFRQFGGVAGLMTYHASKYINSNIERYTPDVTAELREEGTIPEFENFLTLLKSGVSLDADLIIGDSEMPATFVWDNDCTVTDYCLKKYRRILTAKYKILDNGSIEIFCDDDRLGEKFCLAAAGFVSVEESRKLFGEG